MVDVLRVAHVGLLGVDRAVDEPGDRPEDDAEGQQATGDLVLLLLLLVAGPRADEEGAGAHHQCPDDGELDVGEPVGYGGRWKAPRPSKIAVVAAGYGDGYDRHAVDGTPVLVNGQRCPIAGKVSMDMLTVDVTEVPDAAIGSEVVLWGRATQGSVLSVDEVARHCDTISYTLLTGVLPRAPRQYHGANV